ncbi:MAG: enoyl-CoA hydratase/isomerase family protein, partial [Methylocystaceae bacterium]
EKNFAAGADITDMVEGNPEFARFFAFKDTFNKVADLEKPTIAAVAGYALGAGTELALACDFRIAKANTRFGLPEIGIGIMPGAGGTQRLPRLIGLARAKEMIMLGGMVDAAAALSYGLVNKVVEEEVVAEAMKLAAKLAKLPPIALRNAKQVINQGQSMELKMGIDLEAIAWASLFATEDQKEGMRAFVGKRKPEFKGR